MASNSSGMLDEKETYTLGKYVFSIVATRLSDENIMAVTANVVCEGKRAVKGKEFPITTQVEGWFVEANESEASVYVKTKDSIKPLIDQEIPTRSIPPGELVHGGGVVVAQTGDYKALLAVDEACVFSSFQNYIPIAASDKKFNWLGTMKYPGASLGKGGGSLKFSYAGKDVYYSEINVNNDYNSLTKSSIDSYLESGYPVEHIAWTMLYGVPPDEPAESLLGRFEIDLETAGGGPNGDWDEPGDTGDPSYTLNLTVTGASAGTHSSDSFPADNETVKSYGGGGDGGHGGGGGAGASTVIIYEFATSRAGSVNQEAYTREPGVGSGGGKGGKGGDGCILIYY